MKTIKYIAIWTILIGTMAMGLNFIWPNTISFLSTRTPELDNAVYYVYHFDNYLQNLQFATAKTNLLTLAMPEREWQSGAFELIGLVGQISNNLAVILDYGILALNIMIYPFRILAYLIQLIMAFIGFNMQDMEGNAFKWLADLTTWFIERLQIPYI